MVSIGCLNTLNFSDNVKFNGLFFYLLEDFKLNAVFTVKTCEEEQTGECFRKIM